MENCEKRFVNLPSSNTMVEQGASGKIMEKQMHRSTAKIFFQTLIACLGSFYFGYNLAQLNMAQPKLDLVYDIKEDTKHYYQGLLNSALPLGASMGCLMASVLMKFMGRRTSFIVCDIAAILVACLYLIPELEVAIVARGLAGILVGINSTLVPQYIREISPVDISGITGICNQGGINMGIVIGYALGLGFPINELDLHRQSDTYWKIVLTFVPIISQGLRLVFLLGYFRLDTPYYYMKINDTKNCQEAIKAIYKDQYVSTIMQQLQDEVKVTENKVDSWGSLCNMKSKPRLTIGICVSLFQQMCGINAIVFYSSVIFNKTLENQQNANIMTLVQGLLLTIFSFASGVLTKNYGRKSILVKGQIFMGLSLIIVGILSFVADKTDGGLVLGWIIIGFIFVFEIVFSLSIGPVAWVYNADILSSKGLSAATAVNWIAAFCIGLLFPILEKILGISVMFSIFALCCFIGLVYFKSKLVETKGLTQQEIEMIEFNK